MFSERDVRLLTGIGRGILESASFQHLTREERDRRLELGQALLDVRDGVRSELIAAGVLPERRTETRSAAA